MKTNNYTFCLCKKCKKAFNPKSISSKSDIYLADKSPPTHCLKRHALTIFNRKNKKTKKNFCLFSFNINNLVCTPLRRVRYYCMRIKMLDMK